MQSQCKRGLLWVLGPIGAISLGLAWLLGEQMWLAIGMVGFGLIGLCYHASLGSACRILSAHFHKPQRSKLAKPEPVDPQDTDGLIEQMLTQGRYTLLLRPQIAANLEERQYHHAMSELELNMAMVPQGEVLLGAFDAAIDGQPPEEVEISANKGRVVRVEPYFLDRFPVTNEQFERFVAADGYKQLNLWDESIWPALLDFVDRTGQLGPAFWQDGRCLSGLERHPVVGVSWFEAMAYARWVGKRLPTDAEWVKAASWPVNLSAMQRIQRRYPWGDAMEHHRANLWGSGPNMTVPVEDYPDGVSVGGVYHLIGNVWEWTRGDFRGLAGRGELVLDRPMKSIRGGAFDTYFDNQATCQFQSGETPISRRHNIGFRCALSVCDLMLARDQPKTQVPSQLETVPAEEVQV